jgi:DNA-binding NtrC family response regulator
LHYPWPGNVRELENAVERAVLMNDGELLLPAHIGFLYRGADERADASARTAGEPDLHQAAPAGPPPAPARDDEATLSIEADGKLRVALPDKPVKLDDVLDAVVRAAVDRFAGNKSKAADYLGISRFALHRRMQALEKD